MSRKSAGQPADRRKTVRWLQSAVLVAALTVTANGPFALLASASQGTPPPPPDPGHAVLHPVGVAIALTFLGVMISLFRWMFRVPPHLPQAVAKARQSVSALRRILVPTFQTSGSGRAVELACRLGATQKAEIILAYVVEVPFTLNLNVPMPEAEARGQETLRTAQFIVEQHGLPVKTKLIPHRYSWGGILHLAQEESVDAIVMPVESGRPGTEGMGRTTSEVLRRAACEVILDKAPGCVLVG